MHTEPVLLVRRLREEANLPAYAHPGDAGMDLCAVDPIVIEPGTSALVPTGIAVALPPGMEAQVRPRSGLALRHGVTVLNTPGTIDEGYRGEVGVILINHGRERFQVDAGMRIAQLVVQRVQRVRIQEAESLDATRRGEGGFGSTGSASR
jgi:dUTP pyrophosphatase